MTVVDVSLLDPAPDGLDPVTELRLHALHCPMIGSEFCTQRPDHPQRGSLLLR